jgi:hypothetical protein
MKTSFSILSLVALTALVGCGDDDDDDAPSGGEAGEASGGSGAAGSGGSTNLGGSSEPSAGTPGDGEAGADSGGSGGSGGSSGSSGSAGTMTGEAGAGGAPEPEQAYYACQGSDQQFVRRAIQGVLGRRPYGQAEVNLYTDLIAEVDALDAVDPAELPAEPGKPLRHSRKVMLQALFQSPEYGSNWEELYRDFMRVQRVDEYQNAACYGAKVRVDDRVEVAKFVRDNAPDAGGDGGVSPTMADVIAGALELDDISPMYTANLFGMVAKTYLGANGTAVESELGRRRDFGAWFDAVYLNRDPVCLQCHNSEFSVTQTADPKTNRHYPVPALLEKVLLGSSTGAEPEGAFDASDIMHGGLKFARFVATCSTQNQAAVDAAVAAGTIPPDMCPPGEYRLCTTAGSLGPRDWVCLSTVNQTRSTRPWNLATACGSFTHPSAIPLDLAGVNTKFGNVTGLRASVWDMERTLRAGFAKLRTEGLGVDPETREVPDPDKAFAYMTAMTLVEKVWKEITGTGLTIQTYFPRNEASRDQLQHLTDTFVASGYSHKALLEEIYASPYLNLAPPDSECWAGAYQLPRIFDPWVTAEDDPIKRNNGVGDGVAMLSGRTAARSAYGSLGWKLTGRGTGFPNASVSGWPENPVTISGSGNTAITSGTIERQFQNEAGFFNKNTEVGFRGFDFQARLGFEDRFGRCKKLFPLDVYKDVIDNLLFKVKKPGTGTVKDVLEVLKDRIFGDTTIGEAEAAALEALLGKSLDDDASVLTDSSLRRACGAMVVAPQAMMTPVAVVPPDAHVVPMLTLNTDTYSAFCDGLSGLTLPDGLTVSCNGDEPLTVEVTEAAP